MTTNAPIVVLKVGGSLLSLPNLAVRLDAVVQQLRKCEIVRLLVVCGGGEAADIVRRWQTLHGIPDEAAHWLAFRAVSQNEALLSHLLPDALVVQTRAEMRAAWSAGRLPILAAERFVRTAEPRTAEPLPHNWSVTSDSIAAWVAQRIGSERVVLLKSCALPDGAGLGEAAVRGLVDSHFPICAARLAVSWADLRADVPRLIEWQRVAEQSSWRSPCLAENWRPDPDGPT